MDLEAYKLLSRSPDFIVVYWHKSEKLHLKVNLT